MTFLLPIALTLALTVAFPIFAHALRKGRAKPLRFPAAHLVPEKKSSAQQRHRLEDKFLLLLRVLMLLCLALLAASPFVQCSRLALSRTNGASVAAALVIDDSASMRARSVEGATRLQAAIVGAKQLLDTARPGDSFSIVLAGYPARVLTPSTTELSGIREALDSITPTDRRTDLGAALTLARSLQADLPQSDRPIVLLSDLSDAGDIDMTDVVLPEAGLRSPLVNCALLGATRSTEAVQVELSCTAREALTGREVQLFQDNGEPLGLAVPAKDGAVRIELPAGTKAAKTPPQLTARLSAPKEARLDQIAEDDSCVVLDGAAALSVAVRADQGKAGLKTGAGTVLQAALEALDRGVRVQTISLLPDRASELEPYSALFIDDPSGFTPEVGDAIELWVKKGGVGVALLGPGVRQTPLGSNFSPFLEGAPKWESTKSKGADPKIAGSLGPLTTTWSSIGSPSRTVLAAEEDTSVRANWDDGAPFVVERMKGRGLLLSVTLPSSVELSDLALRPAFLELLDHAVSQSAIRRGAQATPVGERWPIADSTTVRAPDGRVLRPEQNVSEEADTPSGEQHSTYVEPDVAGRYLIHQLEADAEGPSFRVAVRDLAEHVSQPNPALSGGTSQKQEAALTKVGISREVALLALLLGALELAFRAFRRSRGGQALPSAVS